MPGPLSGVTVVELAAIGPVPFAAMLLADMGADVVRVERVGGDDGIGPRRDVDPVLRSRRSICLNLKQPAGVEAFLRLVERADVLLEGYRPGVVERLGIGPADCMARNARLVYGRMTGWGQEGPIARTAGHDINYIALTGALHAVGRRDEAPIAPLNLVGDYGGGSMFLIAGVLAALLEATRSGEGQVVDAAMVDGAATLMTLFFGMLAEGRWEDRRGVNVLDTGAPFYNTYGTADGQYVSIGAIEPAFYRKLLAGLGLADDPLFADQEDRKAWPAMTAKMSEVFRTRSRDEWCKLLAGTDACFAPVLSLREAPNHPHNLQRKTFVEVADVVQPAPAPRFSRTSLRHPQPPVVPGRDTQAVLTALGFAPGEYEELRQAGVVN